MAHSLFSGLARRRRQLREATAAGHKGTVAQLRDIATLRMSGSKISMDEYFTLGLFNQELHNDTDITRYGGRHEKNHIHAQLNNIRWEGMVTDKFIQYSLLAKYGVPHPHVQALVTPHIERNAGDTPSLHSDEDIRSFLLNDARYPFFCKAVKGSFGRGTMRADAIDTATATLTMSDGEQLTVDGFCDAMRQSNRFGMLIQDAAQPDANLTPLIGNVVSGLRMIVLVGDDGPQQFRTSWKLPVDGNIVDNFDSGRTGNLVADIDVNNGSVNRVVGGFAANATVNPDHPDTGAQLVGVTLPGWDNISQTVMKAATSFPGFRWQHWDVGITNNGPTIFELNSAGAVAPAQVAAGRGIMDEQLSKFIERYGSRD